MTHKKIDVDNNFTIQTETAHENVMLDFKKIENKNKKNISYASSAIKKYFLMENIIRSQKATLC